MIDIHTHILPQVDDGAMNATVATSLLQTELDQGVKTVVFTPHYYGRKRSPAKFIEERQRAYEKIKENVPENMNVVLGAEVYFSEIGGASFEEMQNLTIGDTRYVLIELPFAEKWTEGLYAKLEDFIAKTNAIPVLAHLERYRQIRRKPQLIERFLQMGCLLQVNVGSFINKRTRRLAFVMLKNGMVSALGTDAHNASDRAPNYETAKAVLKEKGLLPAFENAQVCMQAILRGERVRVAYSAPVKKFLCWYY